MEEETLADAAAEGAEATAAHGEDAAHAAETVGACVDSYGSAIGMPQLCMGWFPNQIFWLVVSLVVIYLILSRFALPRISAVLAERAGTITNDLSAAEELRARAAEAEAAYEKALADARAEANRIVAETRAGIQAELDTEIARADAEIAARAAEGERAIAAIRDQALQSVTEVAKVAATDIVQLLGVSAEPASIEAAVTARVKG